MRGEGVRKAFKAVAASPRWRTGISVILAILTGLVSAALVNEITVDSTVIWASSIKKINFYFLIFLAIINYIYYMYIHKADSEVLKFSDGVFCLAYVRSQLLPDAVEAAKSKIRSGDTGDFEAAMESFEKVLR